MNLLTLENINKSYSEKQLLKDVNLGVNEGDKIGLIGINGAGKSTLLKIVTGRDEFFEGKRTVTKGIRVEYLEQDPDFNPNNTVLEQIFKGETKEMKLLMEYEELLNKINHGEEDNTLQDRLIKLQGTIDSLNLWDLESDAKSILNKLGITNYEEKMGNLSGGQRKRVFLASSLITPCELLILDEPTNHLDADSISWLEEFLNGRRGALLMITHDRYFLDRVANRIIELDRGTLYPYQGNYTDFLTKKIERLEIEKASEDKRQSLIRKELKWVKRGAKARTTKQKARLQRFDELVNENYEEVNTDIDIPYIGRRLGKKTVEVKNLSMAFGEKKLIENFNYTFLKEDRIGIVGRNGVGKSTLLNILSKSLKGYRGEIEYGDTVKVGIFSQHSLEMDENMKAIEYVREGGEVIETHDGSRLTASMLCENFLFDGTMQYTPISKLSGGERRRLQLLRVLMEAPNFLIFDEPTNDLDIETLKILEDFLDKFLGIVIVVSHDRYFLDRVCNKIFYFNGKGTIEIFNGNFSDFDLKLSLNEKEISSIKEENKAKEKEDYKKNRKEKPKFSYKEMKEYETIEDDIMTLEGEIEEVDNEMAKNSSNYGLLNELMAKKEELEEKLVYKYERYEYLSEIQRAIDEYKLS